MEWLQLERLRVDRAIDAARRRDPATVGALALEREGHKRALDTAVESLDDETDRRESAAGM